MIAVTLNLPEWFGYCLCGLTNAGWIGLVVWSVKSKKLTDTATRRGPAPFDDFKGANRENSAVIKPGLKDPHKS